MDSTNTADIAGTIRSQADVESLEATPWRTRIPAVNTYDLLRQACSRHADRTALRLLLAGSPGAPTRSVSYRELMQGIHRAANALHALGVRRGVPVAILLPNLIEAHYALWGSQAAGIASPINPMLEEAYIARICAETKAQVIVSLGPAPGSDIWAKAVAVAEQVGSVTTLMQVDIARAMGAPAGNPAPSSSAPSSPKGPQPQRAGVQVLDFHEALAAAPADRLVSARAFDENDICAYFHTGGTTGYPKVARHSHLNEAFLAWALSAYFNPHDVVLSGLPLFHVNGALGTGVAAFHNGFEVVVLTPGGFRTPGVLDNFWAIAKRFNANAFSAVPTILAGLAGRPWPEGGVPTMRHVMCGAAPLPRQVALDFERKTGLRISEGYGLTEASCVSTLNAPLGEARLGTVGIRLAFQQVGLFRIGADGKASGAAPEGEVGVVGLNGPNVFPGYLRDADNRSIWLAEGWLNTGDLGRFDEQGRLILCGRAKELIIRGGHNIDPSMIEEALARHPAVALVAAVGQPDRHAGELPVAYVALKPGASVGAAELQAHAAGLVPERAAVPVRVEVLDELPLTAVGKLAKPMLKLRAIDHVLQQDFAEQELQAVRVKSRLCPQQGMVVDLQGPAELRERALARAGLYPVQPAWVPAA